LEDKFCEYLTKNKTSTYQQDSEILVEIAVKHFSPRIRWFVDFCNKNTELEKLVDKLAKFIMDKHSDKIINEDACETAIQIIEKLETQNLEIVASGRVRYDDIDGGYTKVGDVWLGQLGEKYQDKDIELGIRIK